MARFLDIHSGMTGLTNEQLQQEHDRDVAIQDQEGVKFQKAWADPQKGTVFCLSEGPSREAVERIHQRAGHPADAVYELKLEI